MDYSYHNGVNRGLAEIAQDLKANSRNVGPSPLGGLFGANQLEGGVTLNPDGTLGSVSPVKTKHHILDALLNHSAGSRSAQAQNEVMQQSALAQAQQMGMMKQKSELDAQAEARKESFLKENAINSAIDEYGKVNNVIVRDQKGQLTDAGHAAIATLDPMKIQASVDNLKRQQQIAADPSVIDAQRKGVIAQANTHAVNNAATLNNSTKTPLGGTTVIMNPDDPTKPTGVIAGGNTSSQSTSQPVIGKGIAGESQHLGDQVSSVSGTESGGYQPAQQPLPSPNDILKNVRSTTANGVTTEINPPTATTAPQSKFGAGIADVLQKVGDSMQHQQPIPQLDSSIANNLLTQGQSLAQYVKPQTKLGELELNPDDSQSQTNSPIDTSSPASALMKQLRQYLLRNQGAGYGY